MSFHIRQLFSLVYTIWQHLFLIRILFLFHLEENFRYIKKIFPYPSKLELGHNALKLSFQMHFSKLVWLGNFDIGLVVSVLGYYSAGTDSNTSLRTLENISDFFLMGGGAWGVSWLSAYHILCCICVFWEIDVGKRCCFMQCKSVGGCTVLSVITIFQ